uniref:Immunoglobulin domain-containing protein n=1 Tax=Heliothis virescens TaxID=7102 RepID=A0A2A4J868_HELVI
MIATQSYVSAEMLRLCVYGLLCTILLAGGATSDEANIQTRPLNKGESFGLSVVTILHKLNHCILKPPHSDEITFNPRDTSQSTDKYVISEGNMLSACGVTVLNVDKNDEGVWVITYDHDGDDAAETETVRIVLHADEPVEEVEEEDEEEDEEDDNIHWLSKINHYTREGLEIDISLDNTVSDEECYIQPPGGSLVKSESFQMEHVTVQKKSNYVSCRITIGPMTGSLLGEWRLCGKPTGKDEMRCQQADIVWNNNASPGAHWEQTTQPRFSHPVHFGGSVNPGVAGRIDVLSCHVITPEGEDLVITNDVKYPHITSIASSAGLCSIKFSDIDRSTLGDWTIYGKFRGWVGGMNEIRLPLTFFLYNEDDPYAQAYNVTVLPEERHLVILGTALNVDVLGSGNVDNCWYQTPAGQTYDLKDHLPPNELALKSLTSATGCRAAFDPITEDVVGEWRIIGKFSNGNQFSERQLTFHVIKEDPANPIIDETRDIEYLPEIIFDTKFGSTNTITIPTASFVENESCHLVTPSGRQYAFIPGYNIPNVEFIEGNGIACGVLINVASLDQLGEWTLISRAARLSAPIERRRPFSIRIEETLSLGNAIEITEGNDLYLSLPNPTPMHDTCKLHGPNNEEVTELEVDTFNSDSCGYIVRKVNSTHTGTWAIVYGNQVTYRATVVVNVIESINITLDNLVWDIGSSVDITVGPEDAVYCKVRDNRYQIVSEGFGPCRIVVDRATTYHTGQWSVSVGITGTVVLQYITFNVDVGGHGEGPVVATSVSRNGESVILTCSVPAGYEISACKFRDPGYNTMVASHGVSQGGYTGTIRGYEMDAESQYCSLRVMTLSYQQEGTWRCAVNTSQGVSHGFLHVTSASVAGHGDDFYPPEPVLRSTDVFAYEGDAVTMSCTIDAPIRYCYFRASNGTVYNVGPSILSPHYEYVGSGFGAGDCGIRFNSLLKSDEGVWSCHVGLQNHIYAEEQRSRFALHFDELIWTQQMWIGDTVTVQMTIVGAIELDYCRFVRIDGLGFTTDNVPAGFRVDTERMLDGQCVLHVERPGMLDLHPWVVAARLPGRSDELSRTTSPDLLVPPTLGMHMASAILLWLFTAILCLLVILAAVSLIPKKNRKWTYARAAHIRDSFRRRPPPTQNSLADQPNQIITDLPPKV